MKPLVLIFDADEEMRSLLMSELFSDQYTLDFASNYRDAEKKILTGKIHLLVTDYKIPEISFHDFFARIKTSIPAVLVLCPQSLSLDSLAENFPVVIETIKKPFESNRLLGQVKALIRKILPDSETPAQKKSSLKFAEITLDPRSFDVFSQGERVKLTPNEFKLLEALLLHQNTVLSREELIQFVQGAGIAVIDRAVDTHIFSLRKKLGGAGDAIETIRGEGYRIG